MAGRSGLAAAKSISAIADLGPQSRPSVRSFSVVDFGRPNSLRFVRMPHGLNVGMTTALPKEPRLRESAEWGDEALAKSLALLEGIYSIHPSFRLILNWKGPNNSDGRDGDRDRTRRTADACDRM